MSRNSEVLQKAEQLVRDVLTKDFHQKPDDAVIRSVARKVAKAIPTIKTPPQQANKQ